jgi:hypothetical protein
MGLGSGLFIRNSLSSGLAHAEIAFPHHLEEEVLNTATEALAFAKEHASWSDRTGDARAGLDVDVRWEGKVVVWEMFHSVDYGLYLETMQSGKYSVIMPTLELFAPEVGRGLRESGGSFD